MTQSEKIEIPLNKGKLTKSLLASIAFVLVGCWLLIYQPTVRNQVFNNPIVKSTVGIGCILFFGFCAFYFSKKLADKKPAIVVDEEGILDNSSGGAGGLVLWSDIKQFATAKVLKQEFLVIVLNNPEDYLSKQTNTLTKRGMNYNYNKYGSPLAISVDGLKCNTTELTTMLERKLSEYKRKVEQYQQT